MTINFITKGKNDICQIYLRLRDSTKNIDVTAKTTLSILKYNFKKGCVIKIAIPPKADANAKREIAKHNEDLFDLEDKLNSYKRTLTNAYNNRKDYEYINSKWVADILTPTNNPKIKVPNELALYFDYYDNAKKGELKSTTLEKIKVIGNRLKAFEVDTDTTIYLQEVNNDFKQRFKDWAINKDYHRNTIIKTIKVIVTVCNHANETHDIVLHHHTPKLTKGKGMKYAETESIYLNFKELNKIENTHIEDKKLDIARDWLLISCFTAQRISDFMRFNINDITVIDNSKFLDIKQEKTDTPVLVYLDEIILKIIKKYNGNFPPLFSKSSKESNEIIYNRLVKKVGNLCGINNEVTAQLKNKKTNRAETITAEKYNFISSHIGRRSYASNYYGKIMTSLLIGATGHSSEQQFLRYVQAKPQANAKELAKAIQELSKNKETPMRVIKNISN
jgi:hypothetical protein